MKERTFSLNKKYKVWIIFYCICQYKSLNERVYSLSISWGHHTGICCSSKLGRKYADFVRADAGVAKIYTSGKKYLFYSSFDEDYYLIFRCILHKGAYAWMINHLETKSFFAVRPNEIQCSQRPHMIFDGPNWPLMHLCSLMAAIFFIIILKFVRSSRFPSKFINRAPMMDETSVTKCR